MFNNLRPPSSPREPRQGHPRPSRSPPGAQAAVKQYMLARHLRQRAPARHPKAPARQPLRPLNKHSIGFVKHQPVIGFASFPQQKQQHIRQPLRPSYITRPGGMRGAVKSAGSQGDSRGVSNQPLFAIKDLPPTPLHLGLRRVGLGDHRFSLRK